MKTFPLKGFGKKFFFKVSTYQIDNSPAYELVMLDEGYEEDYATLSVRLDTPPKEGVWIKNYGGNEDLIQALEDSGMLERTGQVMKAGYATVPSMILTNKAKDFIQK